MRKLGLICFCDKMRKNLICVPILQFIFLSAPNIYTNSIVFGFKKYPNEMGLKIVYTLFVIGLNVHVSGVKLPQWIGLFS